jgi:hypothetical protein
MHADVKHAVIGFNECKLLDTNRQTVLSYRVAHTQKLGKIVIILKLQHCNIR